MDTKSVVEALAPIFNSETSWAVVTGCVAIKIMDLADRRLIIRTMAKEALAREAHDRKRREAQKAHAHHAKGGK